MGKKFLYLVMVAVVSVSLIGCATLFKGKYAKVSFDSDPVGAEVFVDGYSMGQTPIQLKLLHKKPVTVTFKKDGYADKTYVINSNVGGGWVILDCLGGFIPVIIDAVTNNWSSLDSDNIKAVLDVEKVK